TEDKILKYTFVKGENHSGMQKEMRDISAETRLLRDDIMRTNLELPFRFSSETTKVIAATVGFSGGLLLTALGSAVAGPPGAAVGAGIGSAIYTVTQNAGGIFDL